MKNDGNRQNTKYLSYIFIKNYFEPVACKQSGTLYNKRQAKALTEMLALFCFKKSAISILWKELEKG